MVYPISMSTALNIDHITSESVDTEEKQVVMDQEEAVRDEEKTSGGEMRRSKSHQCALL